MLAHSSWRSLSITLLVKYLRDSREEIISSIFMVPGIHCFLDNMEGSLDFVSPANTIWINFCPMLRHLMNVL